MRIDYLQGKSILELILELPNFRWYLREGDDAVQEVKLEMINFVYYERKKPRLEIDMYVPVNVTNELSRNDLSFIETETERGIGLISKVRIRHPFDESKLFAHIPMIDFDMDEKYGFMNEKELIDLIKQKTTETTELNSGVILRSGTKRNYHFIGIGNLLSEEDFITFVGLALKMKYKTIDGKSLTLVDSWHMGNALTAMKYIAEVEKRRNPSTSWSRYGFIERFSTLRVNSKKGYEDYPRVVGYF